jgi:hypothetical protein
MRAINDAYRVLKDPAMRAAYDAQRFYGQRMRQNVAVVNRTAPQRKAVAYAAPGGYAPTPLQRRVDRIVAVLGVVLIVCIGLYSVFVIPRAEQQFQQGLRGDLPPTSAATVTAPKRGTASNVPDRLLSDAGLRNFPGAVLVPPSTLAPFKDLPILRLDASSQGIARYAVYYGDLTTGVASISGLTGRASFDAAIPRLANCAADATYCAGPGVGQSPSDPPGVELFRPADLVVGYPAFASHRVCCNGVSWSLSWYEQQLNMSYTIDLSRNVAMQFGGTTADDDLAAARSVAALASDLVRLP